MKPESNAPLLVNPQKIRDRIKQIDHEKTILESLLASIDAAREIAVFGGGALELSKEPTAARGPGRPRKAGVFDLMVDFVTKQTAEFTNLDMRKAVGETTDRLAMADAIRKMKQKDLIEVVVAPLGRRPGIYRRKGEVK